MHPQKVYEKPAGIGVADQPGAHFANLIAHENADRRRPRVAKKNVVISPERINHRLAVFARNLFHVVQAKPWR